MAILNCTRIWTAHLECIQALNGHKPCVGISEARHEISLPQNSRRQVFDLQEAICERPALFLREISAAALTAIDGPELRRAAKLMVEIAYSKPLPRKVSGTHARRHEHRAQVCAARYHHRLLVCSRSSRQVRALCV